jgi:hypothetical protein
MIIRPALALALAVLATPVAALAGDYRVMGEDERAISFIESAIKTDSDGRKETVFFIAFAEPVGGATGPQVVSSAILFDCVANRYKIGEMSSFSAAMAPVQRSDTRYGWRDVVADSPFSRAAAYACQAVALPRADSAEVKTIVAGYLSRRAAAAPAAAPAPEPAPAGSP